ncbi:MULTISPECIES: hypothetical protein [Georgenia]|nr:MULTISPECIES: hypothetical protein [Georgenia]
MLATTALRSSWRDALAARYEVDQARLRMRLDAPEEAEEHI